MFPCVFLVFVCFPRFALVAFDRFVVFFFPFAFFFCLIFHSLKKCFSSSPFPFRLQTHHHFFFLFVTCTVEARCPLYPLGLLPISTHFTASYSFLPNPSRHLFPTLSSTFFLNFIYIGVCVYIYNICAALLISSFFNYPVLEICAFLVPFSVFSRVFFVLFVLSFCCTNRSVRIGFCFCFFAITSLIVLSLPLYNHF